MRVDKEPAFLLHSRAYRESSTLVEVLTLNYGRVGLVHKGSRRMVKTGNPMQPFCELILSWGGRGDLYTLTRSDVLKFISFKDSKLNLCGLYLNELIMSLTPRLSPSPELYHSYKSAITLINDSGRVELYLRRFEIQLLKAIGYGLQLEYDAESHQAIDPALYYYYDYEQGPIARSPSMVSQPLIRGQTLVSLKLLEGTDQQTFDKQTSREAKHLLRGVIDHHLQNKPILTRKIMQYIDE